MVRSVLADENLLPYIQNLAVDDKCTTGLILGQPTPSKDYVFHFAKTPPLVTDDVETPPKTVNDVSDTWVADHAKHVTRMLPGGTYILGIFIVSQDDILTSFSQKVKNILSKLQADLSENVYMYGNSTLPEKLVLNYCCANKNFVCKSYNVSTANVSAAEFKFQPKPTKWNQLECQYDLDITFPMFEGRLDWDLKKHTQAILRNINDSFKSAVYLFDNEIKDQDDTLESIGKKKKINKAKTLNEKNDSKVIQIAIFTPYNEENDLEVRACGGFVKITGQISSKLWLFPKVPISFASEAVAQDIVRSLAARLEMHWDSLVDEGSGSSEDINCLHEPPRRVLMSLPSSKVMLSDYLFPGEGAHEALISMQELIDITILDENSIVDAEGQADLSDMYPVVEALAAESDESIPSQLTADSHKFFYTAVICVFVASLIGLTLRYTQE